MDRVQVRHSNWFARAHLARGLLSLLSLAIPRCHPEVGDCWLQMLMSARVPILAQRLGSTPQKG